MQQAAEGQGLSHARQTAALIMLIKDMRGAWDAARMSEQVAGVGDALLAVRGA